MKPVEWAKLNGYVDGELDTASAADVALSIAADPKLAKQAAAIHELKAVLASLHPDERAPDYPMHLQRRSPSRRIWLAAAAVLLLLGGAVVLTQLSTSHRATMLDQAFQAHATWLTSIASTLEGQRDLDATLIANLAAADLNLVHASAGDGTEPRLLGFEGPHGCKLGLWIAKLIDATPLNVVRPIPAQAGIQAVSWRTADATYVLMTKAMDDERFARYAQAVSTMVIRGRDAQDLERIAVRSVAQSGTACSG